MKSKRLYHSLIVFVLIISFAFCSLTLSHRPVSAEVDIDAENRAKLFMQTMYKTKDIEYEQVEVKYSVEMFDDENNVIAQVTIFERDDKIDYAVYNYIKQTIDEYGFDCPEAIEKFPISEEFYYLGSLNYYRNEGSQVENVFTGEKLNKNKFFEKIDKLKEINNKKEKGKNSGTNDSSAYHVGYFTWDALDEEIINFDSSDYGYLQGISWLDISDSSGLDFTTTVGLSNGGEFQNICTPVAITNIMIYYQWLHSTVLNTNKTIIVNGAVTGAFNEIRGLCNHDSNTGTSLDNARSAIINYLANRGVTATLTNFSNDYSMYKQAIDNEQIILTGIYLDNTVMGHSIVTLGYEEFVQVIERPVLWWTKTEYNYLRYLRVCNGFSPQEDDSVYIQLDGYYDSYENSAINIVSWGD